MDFLFFCIFSSIYKTSSFNIKHFVFPCVNDVAISMQLIFSSIKDKSFFIHVLSLKSWQDRVRNPKSVKVKRWNSVIPCMSTSTQYSIEVKRYPSLYVIVSRTILQFHGRQRQNDNIGIWRDIIVLVSPVGTRSWRTPRGLSKTRTSQRDKESEYSEEGRRKER